LRKGTYPNIKFDFLVCCFRTRLVQNSRDNTLFCSFSPAVSPSALKSMRAKIRELGIRRRTELSLAEIAHRINPLMRGWIDYYGRYAPSALAPLLRYINQRLRAWAMRKFRRFKAHKIRASHFLQMLSRRSAHLFVHWWLGMTGTFAWWELSDARVSRFVLREVGGETPPAYSPHLE
jgi:RNA-directed DNA polymerase